MKQWQNLTDMITDCDVIDEMLKKYKQTILGIDHNHKIYYAQFEKYDNKLGMFLFTLKNGDKITVAKDTNIELFIPNPEKGLYNTPKGAMFFYRNPLRQWKRGMCSANVIIKNVNDTNTYNSYTKGENYFSSIWNDVLIASENPFPISLDDAITTANTRGSAAINTTYGVVLHPNKEEGYVLLHHLYHIGEIYPKEKQIYIKNRVFQQEIMDTIRTWAPNYRISV